MSNNFSNGDCSNNRTADIMVSLSVGVLAGVVGALLLAPSSGQETRRRLGELADSVSDKTGKMANRLGEVLKEQTAKVEHAIVEGKQAYRQSPTDRVS